MTLPRAIVSWSTGKDCALALYFARVQNLCQVEALLTTLSETDRRINIHGIPESLLEQQASCVSLPLQKVALPSPCPNAVYETRVRAALSKYKDEGITQILFGDLFLDDIRSYREEKLVKDLLNPVYPVWGKDTKTLPAEFLSLGFRALVVAVDTKKLPANAAGKEMTAEWLAKLPAGVDPCGENGEFHTFVFDGPIFTRPVEMKVGAVKQNGDLAQVEVS